MKTAIKKGDKFLMDIGESFPVEMKITEIFEKKSIFGLRTYVYLEGERYAGGLRTDNYTSRMDSGTFENNVIRRIL